MHTALLVLLAAAAGAGVVGANLGGGGADGLLLHLRIGGSGGAGFLGNLLPLHLLIPAHLHQEHPADGLLLDGLNHGLEHALFFKSLSYRSLPLTVGYGYNLAFGENWSAGLQLLASLSYIWSKGDAYDDRVFIDSILKDFSFSNFTFDGTIRFGVVWNNSRWFAGANAIYHTYHYHQSHLEANNIFGTINFYVGFNFWRR